MQLTQRSLVAARATLLLASFTFAATSVPPLSERGKLLFSDDFSGDTLAPGWAGKVGNFESAKGSVKVSERPEDKHAAVRRHPLKYHDAIFEFSFRFDGASPFALMMNAKSAHISFLYITPTGMYLQLAKGPNESAPPKIASFDTKIESGKWHKAVVEVHGMRMTARLDDKLTISAETPRVDVDKTDFGFLVGGVSASLDYVKVFEVLSK